MFELEEDESDTGDVEDEAVLELEVNPGITKGTQFSVTLPLFGPLWSLNACPHMRISVFSAKCVNLIPVAP